MRLRVERQTLRRLPRGGAIVFTIRVYMTPLGELGPGEAGRLAGAIRGVKEQEVVYRCVCCSFLFFLSGLEPGVESDVCVLDIEGSLILKTPRSSGWMGSIEMKCSEC
jgi:hypothetical protein